MMPELRAALRALAWNVLSRAARDSSQDGKTGRQEEKTNDLHGFPPSCEPHSGN
jgi:hypothetical protein